jgi:signal transduction histidine kinase
MRIRMPGAARAYLAEPAVPEPPARVWRDWLIAGATVVASVLEAALRGDAAWTGLPWGWRAASLAVAVAVMPAALLNRRTRPLGSMLLGFGAGLGLGAAMSLSGRGFGGLTSQIVVLVVPYALFRWGSGRAGAIGALVMAVAVVIGNLTDPASGPSEWIGGAIVLALPALAGLLVRYRSVARERALAEARAGERADLARDLHDTIAHHVSAIAVQAQAGQAVADPERARAVLAAIEREAAAALAEMRTVVGTLRNGGGADLTPQRGIGDLNRLAGTGGPLTVDVDVRTDVGPIGQPVSAAIFRIAQESVTNAARHARGATRVVVRLEAAGSAVHLTVGDDGHTAEVGTPGFGLIGMAERAQLLGGELVAGPRSSGNGWEVSARLPRGAA